MIGSLPRPQVVRDLVTGREELASREYPHRLDDIVRFAIRPQEQAGLDVVKRRAGKLSTHLATTGGPVCRPGEP